MAEVAVIGSSYIEESIICNSTIAAQKVNTSTISRYYSGNMRNIAINLANLGCRTSFCTKYGNDVDAVEMWGEVENLSIMQYAPTVAAQTPVFVSVHSRDGKLAFSQDMTFFEFNTNDSIPSIAYERAKYVVTDIRNPEVLFKLIQQSATKWIVTGHIPDKNILPLLDGVILTYDEALMLGAPAEFDRVCYRLCNLGLNWVIIHMENQGIYLYQNYTSSFFESLKPPHGYPNGCFSAFVSGIVYSLAQQHDLKQATELASTIERITFAVESPTTSEIKQYQK